MTPLTYALRFAAGAHDGQLDKQGQPYILHVLRVMGFVHAEEQRIIALLHDVIEDTPVMWTDLARRFSQPVVNAVEALTHRPMEPYQEYIERVCQNRDAVVVKMADLDDHESRIHELDAATQERLLKKYIPARVRLLAAL